MLAKYGSAKIVQASVSLSGLFTNQSLIKRATKKFADIDMDPDTHIYLRNRAISALEIHGPNQNWDAFEYNELENKYSSFIGKDITVDHIGTDVIGTVLDSEFIRTPDIQGELDIPYLPLKEASVVLAEKCKRDSVFSMVLDYANANKLVKSSDKKMIIEAVAKTFCTNSGWIENIWAIEKKAAEEHTKGLVKALLSNSITDTSMGTLVNEAVCSVCGNVATGELPEHEDFCDCIRLYKGMQFPINGILVIPFEINRDIDFFEDSLILPFEFGGKAGGEGADVDAKLLEVFSASDKKTASNNEKKSYMETTPGWKDYPSSSATNPSIYVMIGDMPENVAENKEEFNQQRIDFSEESQEAGIGDGDYPEGTIIKVVIDDGDVDAIVVEEKEDNLIVAIDGFDEPIEIGYDDILDVLEYPEEMSYEKKMDITDVLEVERHPEQRAAGLDKKDSK